MGTSTGPGSATAGSESRPAGTAGARGSARTLLSAAAKRDIGPHALAHLGAVDLGLRTARAALDQAADEIDADPGDRAARDRCGPCGSAR